MREVNFTIRVLALVSGAVLGIVSTIRAEFPQIEKLIAPVIEPMVAGIDTRSVIVASRHIGDTEIPWAAHEAISVELTAALRAHGIDAVRASSHPWSKSLEDARTDFAREDIQVIKKVGRDGLVAISLYTNRTPQLNLAVFSAARSRPIWTRRVPLSPGALVLEANVPELNSKVVKFCRDNLDTCVGSGVCAQLATVALDTVGAERSGVYSWGRELDSSEPIMPGDILQLELVEMKLGDFSREFPHHTAVVDDVAPNTITVLHQNVGSKGKIVQRDIWLRAALRSGTMVAYRPWKGESSLPPVSPRRRLPPTLIRNGKTTDLLRTLDPKLDSIKGIWYMDRGLKWNRDDYARLQVPVTPPENYTLKLKVRRLFGDDQFGIGLIVGGRQTLLTVDAYGGQYTGLHLLDGKKSKDNDSTHEGAVLPLNQMVDLEVRVRPNAVTLWADGRTIVDWSGDASRLGQDERYAVPRTDWLFLASWNTQCEVSEFLLIDE